MRSMYDIINDKGENAMRNVKRLPSISISRQVCLITVVLCVFGSCSFPQQAKRDLTKQSDLDAYVDELTGFGTLKAITKSFERVDVNDDNTPFLHSQINRKRNIWRVRIKNVRLKLKSAIPWLKDRYVRNFEVLVDPNTGHLLRIRSKFDGHDPNMLPEPPAEVAEEEMRNSGNEIYHGFPLDPPKISLLDALDAVMGSPYLAKEIYAVHVIQSDMGSKPRAVWAITLRGIPPITRIGPSRVRAKELLPVWQLNHIRNVLDASTGKLLFATSCPQPLPPEEKKKE
jgi:hypothetical protein